MAIVMVDQESTLWEAVNRYYHRDKGNDGYGDAVRWRHTSSDYLLDLDNAGGNHLNAGGVLTVQDSGVGLGADLTLTGTGRRIKADFSNASLGFRLMFQSSTANGSTLVGAIPNGSGTVGGFSAYNNATPGSASLEATVRAVATAMQIRADSPAGSYLPIVFITNNTVNAALTTAGALTATTMVAGSVSGAVVGSEVLRVAGSTRFEVNTNMLNTFGYRGYQSGNTTARNLAMVDSGNILQYGESGATGAVVNAQYVQLKANGTVRFSVDTNGLGFYGSTPIAKPTVVGSRGGNVALQSLIDQLGDLGLITDLTT